MMPQEADDFERDLLVGLAEINPLYLPKFIREMVERIGPEATGKIILKYGGYRLYVPGANNALKYEGNLVDLIGKEKVDKLRYDFPGGCLVEIPFARVVVRCVRDSRIIADYKGGMTVWDLTQKYNLTSRHIRNICK